MIIFATLLVMLGLSTFGAVLGSVFAFILSLITAIIIFKKYLKYYFPTPKTKLKINDELKLAKN